MGKTTKTETKYLPSTLQSVMSVNGKPLVSTNIDGNTIYSKYYYSPEEEALNKYVQSSLTSFMPKVNTFLPETITAMDNQIAAYTRQGVDSINAFYTPMITSLENDVASRFGNLDNSVFMDSLKGIETSRAKAVSSLSNDILAKRSELENNELQKQYDYLSFLTGYKNQSFQNMLNASKLNQSNLSLNNDYLADFVDSSTAKANSKNTTESLGQLATYLAALAKLA